MYWLLLVIAGIFEIAFILALKYANGLTKLVPTLFFILFEILSLFCLAKTLNKIPVGTAYAVWTAAGTALLGVFVFNEPTSIVRLFFITTLVISIIGLKMS